MTLNAYLILSAVLFFIGMIGVLRRKIFLCFFLNGNYVKCSKCWICSCFKVSCRHNRTDVCFFIIAIAASEVAIGLGLLILWYKKKVQLILDTLQSMKG
ncbi:MAG: NADH-quinone oxidoreductase subunit NuoK [Halarcobacter ebronensis]